MDQWMVAKHDGLCFSVHLTVHAKQGQVETRPGFVLDSIAIDLVCVSASAARRKEEGSKISSDDILAHVSRLEA